MEVFQKEIFLCIVMRYYFPGVRVEQQGLTQFSCLQDLNKGFNGLFIMTCQEFRQQFMINMETIQEVVNMYWVPVDKKKMSMDNKENEPQESTRERLRNGRNKLHIGKKTIRTSIHLRNILEQSIAWQAPLYVSFIDFKKSL